MLIQILMGIFALLMLSVAYYLLTHINEPFIKIAPENTLQYKFTTQVISILFILSAIFSVVTIFLNSKMLSLAALFFGSICAAYYAIFISNKINI